MYGEKNNDPIGWYYRPQSDSWEWLLLKSVD